MKARKVDGLHPDMPLAQAAGRIAAVRAQELWSFAPDALDPDRADALHDLRIAAKRLRYLLEAMAPVLGPEASHGARRARALQDLVGEIHDCDVLAPRVLDLLDDLRARDAADLRRRAAGAEDLDPGLAAHVPHRDAYRGLEVLAAHLQARRGLLFERFAALWEELDREGLRERLAALAR